MNQAHNKFLDEFRSKKEEEWKKENPTTDGAEEKKLPAFHPTVPESEEMNKRAEEICNQFVEKFIKMLDRLAELGADLTLKVDKKFEFRKENLKENKIIPEEDEQEEFIRKSRLAKKNKNASDTQQKTSEYGEHGLKTILHFISLNPHIKLVNYILEKKLFDINSKDFIHQTPFYLLCKNSNKIDSTFYSSVRDNAEIYIQHGADINLPDLNDCYPIHEAVNLNSMWLIELLAKHKANFNVVSRAGDIPLLTAMKGTLANTEHLLKLGADPNFSDQMNRNSLHHAINNDKEVQVDASFQLEKILIRYKADINHIDKRGRTPLHYAFLKIGNIFEKDVIDPIEVVSSMLEIEGCNADVQDSLGATPLHLAAQRGAYLSCLTLLNKGVSKDLKDKFGNTPLAVALKCNHSGIATLLIQSGADVSCKVHVHRLENPFVAKVEMQIEKESKNHLSDDEDDDEDGLEDDEVQSEEEAEEKDYKDQKLPEIDTKSYDGFFIEDKAVLSGHGGYHWNTRKQTKYGNVAIHKEDLPLGSDSSFIIAIRRAMQGVTYLLVQKGYPLSEAIHDTINERKFKYTYTLLTKAQKGEILNQKNDQNQTILHSFAIQGPKADLEIRKKILEEMFYWKIDLNVVDDKGNTALHYAALKVFDELLVCLLEGNADPNLKNKDDHTPFSLMLTNDNFTVWRLNKLVEYNAKINQKFKHRVYGKEIYIGPIAYLASEGSKTYASYEALIKAGVSINDTDENGVTALMYAIKENSKALVAFFLKQEGLDFSQKDKDGKTPIHYVVNPVRAGSYENVDILKMLKDKFDINAKDNAGRPPIFYAYLQDSGVLVDALKALGAADSRPTFTRQPTSIISSTPWNEHEVDYEGDSEQFIKKSKEVDDKIMVDESEHKKKKPLVQPDPSLNNIQNCEVCVDPELGPYSLLMTRVDVRTGGYSLYLFYRMQVVHELNRDVYVLFTRWGRIGETGAYQQTPFASKEECIKEFHKIFKDKSGNLWEDQENFKKIHKKYQLHKLEEKRPNARDYFLPIDYSNPKIPKSELPEEVQQIMKAITSVKMYQRAFERLSIDREAFPLANISRDLILEVVFCSERNFIL